MEKQLDSGNPSNIGQAGTTAKTSASEDFFRYMLLKERLGAGGKEILEAKSEKDLIMEQILRKIVRVRESTAEWSELVSLTGSENRFVMAEKLADIAWEKKRAELVLEKYVGSGDHLKAVYDESQSKVRTIFGAGGFLGGGGSASSTAPATEAFGALTGLRF
jgi:hypothetical protein